MSNKYSSLSKEKVISFIWQHVLLVVSLYFMTLGVAMCVRSDLGSSVISSCPLAFTLAGAEGLVPALSLGTYTNILNALLVAGQIAVLRRRFNPVQLFQLVIGFIFGALIDMNMAITSAYVPESLAGQIAEQFIGCTVMAAGIAMEIRCASVTMPGEGLPVAIAKVTGKTFADIKIIVDITLVATAIAACFLFFGQWKWNVVGIGTLLAMVYVGAAVKIMSRHMDWFERLLNYRPGFRRYIFGLARYLYS
ncbi:MAG: hypothetical protein K2I57_04520, partial [Muribaculaceae bacterium]|nr:hypothetical protein [Muribaculaceae bacterium]